MDIDLIKQDLADSYSKKTLLVLLLFMGVNIPESSSKEFVIDSLLKSFNKENPLKNLYENISKKSKIVLNHLVWEGVSNLSIIESLNNCKISVGDYYINSDDPFIQNFKNYHSREIQLSTGLRSLFKRYIPMPKIEIDQNIGEEVLTDYKVLQNFKAIIDFINFNRLNEREPNKKILIKDIKKYIKDFNLPESSQSQINGSYVLKFLSHFNYKKGLDNYDNFLYLIKSYRNGSLFSFNIDSYLFYPHIKGVGDNEHIELFLKRGRQAVINKISNKNSAKWQSIKSQVRELSLNEETQIFDTSFFGSILYVKCEPTPENMFSKKLYLQFKNNNEEYLIKPLVSGIVLLFNFLGVVDISIKDGEISHYRLSELGKKIFNLSSTFNINSTPNGFEYKFNKDKLIITTKGVDNSKTLFFKRIGREFNKGIYIVNFKEFFKECKTLEDIQLNISTLENLLGNSVPKNWEDFLSELNDRINPVYNEQQLIVVNFPWENKKLIELITENEKIRSLYYMVEGVKGAFSRQNYEKFRKFLQEEGYFL